MSKGSRIITLRLPPELEARVMETIESNNRHRREEEWTITSWVIDCIREKLRHQSAAQVQREKRQQAARDKRRLAELGRLLHS